MKEIIKKSIKDSSEIINESTIFAKEIEEIVLKIVYAFKNNNKVILFGNGGSAADAQHIAAEFIGRFQIERESFPAIALTTDTSILTALSNDYSNDIVFSRQCESLVSKNDVVIGISTSGNSRNVEKGLIISKQRGAITIGLLGNNGGRIKNTTDIQIIVKSSSTAKIQEVHRVIYHIICELVELEMAKK
jgi:D-sedoheptulose 7-phosphate isomerase